MKKRLTLTLNQDLSKNLVKTKADALVIGVNEGRVLNTISATIDAATNGAIKKLIKRGEFEAKVGQASYIATNDGVAAERIYLIGLGKSKKSLSNDDLDKISSAITNSLSAKKSSSGLVSLPLSSYDAKDLNDSSFLQKLGTSLESRAYTYDAKLNKKNKSVNHLKKSINQY